MGTFLHSKTYVSIVSAGNCFWDSLGLWLRQPGKVLRCLVAQFVHLQGVRVEPDTLRRIQNAGAHANNAVVTAVCRVLEQLLPSGIVIMHQPTEQMLHYRAFFSCAHNTIPRRGCGMALSG